MDWLPDLESLLGADRVAADEPTRRAHGGDKWFAEHDPDVVVFPGSTEEVSRVMQFATKHKIPVTARGAGYGYVGGCVPMRGGISLSLERMKRIKEIHFADAVAIVSRPRFEPKSSFIRPTRRACRIAASEETWPQTRVAHAASSMG